MARQPRTIPARILDAALKLAAERRWHTITLGDIAAAARVSLAQLHQAYPSKTAIVCAWMERTDDQVLGGMDAAILSEPPRDRLLDALAPHKEAAGSLLRGLGCDPVAALCLAPGLLNSMAWTLEAAGIGSPGVGGRLRVKGLAVIYLSALGVWLGDDSADQGPTLAFLDRRLRQAERVATLLPHRARDGAHGEAGSETP